MAREAGRSSVRSYINNYLRSRSIQQDAYVFQLATNAINFFVPKFSVETIAFLDDLKNQERFKDIEYDESKMALVNSKTREIVLKHFDHVKIELKIDSNDPSGQKTICKIIDVLK